MVQGEHSAILSTFIKLLFVIKIFILYIFKWPLKTDISVIRISTFHYCSYSPDQYNQTEHTVFNAHEKFQQNQSQFSCHQIWCDECKITLIFTMAYSCIVSAIVRLFVCCFTSQVNGNGQFSSPHFFLSRLEQAVHLLSLVTGNNPS